MVGKFTNLLYEFAIDKGLSLQESLEIISQGKEKQKSILKNTGKFLKDEMLRGTTFANSLRKCSFIRFDDIYIAFINYGERTGCYKETVSFLRGRCNRKKENQYKLLEVGLYPAFVILLGSLGTYYLWKINYLPIGQEIFPYLGLLLFICFLVFMAINKCIGENKLYEAFLGIGFLLKAGINLYDAVGFGAQIIGISSRYGQKFLEAREKLLLGMDLKNAFNLGEKYNDAFYYAEKSGGKTDFFEKIAKWIGQNDERRRKICFALMEPLFICLAGMFLIVLVAKVFLPYITNLSIL